MTQGDLPFKHEHKKNAKPARVEIGIEKGTISRYLVSTSASFDKKVKTAGGHQNDRQKPSLPRIIRDEPKSAEKKAT